MVDGKEWLKDDNEVLKYYQGRLFVIESYASRISKATGCFVDSDQIVKKLTMF